MDLLCRGAAMHRRDQYYHPSVDVNGLNGLVLVLDSPVFSMLPTSLLMATCQVNTYPGNFHMKSSHKVRLVVTSQT